VTNPAALLAVEQVVAGYEPGSPIVGGVSLVTGAGEIVAVFGANGAGKSTLVKAIAGLVPVVSGSIRFDGHDITGLPAHLLVARGLAFVPQTENVFATLSVGDNLLLAAQPLKSAVRGVRLAEVYGLFPDLARQRRLSAGRLSGGQRQMLAVARALVVAPKLLLLDEPSAGLSPKVVDDLFRRLVEIRASGVGVVLVEQNARAALAVADRLYVLAAGRNHLQCTGREMRADPAMAALHLGALGTRAAPTAP
jgi:branched-chain amino acid transport system ATP-binding protein